MDALIEHKITDAEIQDDDEFDVTESNDSGYTEESDDGIVDTVSTWDDSSNDEEAGQEQESDEEEADLFSRKQAAFKKKVLKK